MQNELLEEKPLLLVFPHNVMAHYLRCIQLAKRLQPQFKIKFLYSKRYASYVNSAGFETFDATTLDADKVQQCMECFDFSWLNERDLSMIYRDQVKVINDLKPVAVLGDMAPTLKMAAEKTGVFYWSIINGYMSRYYAFVRRMPRRYPLYKLFNLLPTSLYSYFTNVGEHIYFHDIHRPFSKIRKRGGLATKHSYMQEMEGDLNLICDLPEIFPQKELPENYLFTPPLFQEINNNNESIISKLDPKRKTILINMGSTGNWKKVSFINNVQYQEYNIVTAGDTDKIINGVNVFSYPFVNNSHLFNLVDLVICHGGNGTCYQALSHGIPVLALSTHVEQDYNVDGLERSQLGMSLNDIKEQDYKRLIEQWISKKGSSNLVNVKQKINEANFSFEGLVRTITSETLRYKNCTVLRLKNSNK
ncbi:MAG: hypothetical protein JWQ96_1811 [Segetibacter sp.]|nr:hypothetical protein [Segetibacter sp.]